MTAVVIAAAAAATACRGPAAPIATPPRDPPPKVVVATLDRVSLRATAWTSLHALLASRASAMPRVDGEPRADGARGAGGSAFLDAPVVAYARARTGDPDDEHARDAMTRLSRCTDEACAAEALRATAYAEPLGGALATFVARREGGWSDEVEAVLGAIEDGRGALGPESDALGDRAARDLGIAWPAEPVVVPIVGEAPSPAGRALLPIALAARGGCFVTPKDDTRRVHDARIIDCVLTRALLALAEGSPGSGLREALGRRIASPEARDRALSLAIVHAIAATVTGWEPRHASPYRASAAGVDARTSAALRWLAAHWRERAAGEDLDAFADRYAAELARLDAAAPARE